MQAENWKVNIQKVRFKKGEELLRAENLSVPGLLDNVSFSLHAGEILGITGLMGAGKTEVAKNNFWCLWKRQSKINMVMYICLEKN